MVLTFRESIIYQKRKKANYRRIINNNAMKTMRKEKLFSQRIDKTKAAWKKTWHLTGEG